MSWGLGCWIEDQQNQEKRFPSWSFLELFSLFIPLILFKYWDWLGWNINALAAYTGSETTVPTLDWVLPVGISFSPFKQLPMLWM